MILTHIKSLPVRRAYRAIAVTMSRTHPGLKTNLLSLVFADDNTQIVIAHDGYQLAGAASYNRFEQGIHLYALVSFVQGAGSALMELLEGYGYPEVRLVPQPEAMDWWKKRGYTLEADGIMYQRR